MSGWKPSQKAVLGALYAAILSGVASPAVRAQVLNDQNLSSATVVETNGCSVLKLEFYGRVQLHSFAPQTIADELRIQLLALDRGAPPQFGRKGEPKAAEGPKGVRREQVRAPLNDRAAISSIELENAGVDQRLSIYFKHAVSFKVGPGNDPRVLLVAIAGHKADAACVPVLTEPGVAVAPAVPRSAGSSGNAALDEAMSEARSAMSKQDYDRAIAYLTKVVDAGASKLLPEALELIGFAREQKGHFAHARADYQAYLKQVQQGDGRARVQQRLAALDKREQMKFAAAPAASDQGGAKLEGKVYNGPVLETSPSLKSTIAGGGDQATPKQPETWIVQHAGSLSAYYHLNQGGRDVFTRPKLQQGWEKENIYQTYRNSTLALGDYEGIASNPFYQARVHVAASQEHRFTDETDEFRVSSLNVEGKSKETGTSVRVGRQTHFGGGVLGRFDGGLVTQKHSDDLTLRSYGGSPVERSGDAPFEHNRFFFGGSADYRLRKGFDVGAFAVEQRTDDFVDRRALGVDTRVVDETRHGYSTIEYDVHFGEINNVLATGTQNFADGSSITGLVDYRRSPSLFATSALQGQVETSLRDLLQRYTLQEIEDLARDRTPLSTVASVAYSRPLREDLHLSADVTVTNMSSMPGSGGVAAAASTGWDIYAMVQLMASDVFRERDSVTGSIRHAITQSADRTLVEGYLRMPMFDPDWFIGPTIRLGYSDYKLEPTSEYLIHPMLRTSYNLTRNVLMDLEIGKRWTMRDTFQGRSNETEFLVLSGVRYDFHSER